MTTIEEGEMDEFFNFEDAAHPHCLEGVPHDHSLEFDLNLLDSSYDLNNLRGPYDENLAFSTVETDDAAFSSLQHYSDSLNPSPQFAFDSYNPRDTTMLGPDDFTDFPRWVDGMSLPNQPCGYCEIMRIHCKVIREGTKKGSCTSCVALARDCSLVTGDRTIYSDFRREGSMRLPSSEDDTRESNDSWILETGNDRKAAGCSLTDLNRSSHSMSAPDLKALNFSNENLNAETGEPKVGARFSRESLRVLRQWLTTHHRHPYPNDEEKESLRRQTGLTKTQITNWLANARRRGKVRAPRSTSPGPQQFANGMDIPRRSTPGLQQMNPLERWKHSPPEHEPASVTAIAKAVSSSTLSSSQDSTRILYGNSDDGSARSICNVSSTSSFGTSHSSNNSFASAFSHKSRGSFGSFSSFGNRGRRRRRRQAPNPIKSSNLTTTPRTFQCTFCTETFKTKHDWQRHEKSLHLSLERWICSPNGPVQFNPEVNAVACVYCGAPSPLEGHCEQHNHSSCAERTLEERTFYRKDHLRQHLNLVHDAKFAAWSMESWKVATPEIRSRCGFCGIVMESWTMRVDHLAEHFKGGKSMADWKGDWGFEPQVLDIVENGMPPYMIHDERNTMKPFEASTRDSTDTGKTLEDLVKIGLVDYINDQVVSGTMPGDWDLLEDAKRVIRRADALNDGPPEISWFRDLIMLSKKSPRDDTRIDPNAEGTLNHCHAWAERLNLVKSQTKTHAIAPAQITCAKELALNAYVKKRQAIGLTPTDSELQVQACKILDEVELTSAYKCKGAIQWFKYLITSSSSWLAQFRSRAVLPRSSDMADEAIRSSDSKTIDYSIHNYHRLERELIDFVNEQRNSGRTPSDAELQAKARMIIFESDDTWNQTAADDPAYLRVFKRQNGLATIDEEETELPTPTDLGTLGLSLLSSTGTPPTYTSPSPRSLHWDLEATGLNFPFPTSAGQRQASVQDNFSPTSSSSPVSTFRQSSRCTNTNPVHPIRYSLSDGNCFFRLVRELTRYVHSCMSPNNPASHIPSDAEIQNQARWVIYDDDDPWNQTAADNAEWLMRFKRDVGLLPADEGSGLPLNSQSWPVVEGASAKGIPSYAASSKETRSIGHGENSDVSMHENVHGASVFCSRDLEHGLSQLVQSELANGRIPSDEWLREKARDILGVEQTAADDVDLLKKFKTLHGIANEESIIIPAPVSTSAQEFSLPDFSDDAMLAEFDLELGSMDLSPDLSTSDVIHPSVEALVDPDLGTGFKMEEPLGMRGNEKGGESSVQSYADFHRVHAATASPLRRRASERLATSSGLQRPSGL